jgi:hypothetical protein
MSNSDCSSDYSIHPLCVSKIISSSEGRRTGGANAVKRITSSKFKKGKNAVTFIWEGHNFESSFFANSREISQETGDT